MKSQNDTHLKVCAGLLYQVMNELLKPCDRPSVLQGYITAYLQENCYVGSIRGMSWTKSFGAFTH